MGAATGAQVPRTATKVMGATVNSCAALPDVDGCPHQPSAMVWALGGFIREARTIGLGESIHSQLALFQGH